MRAERVERTDVRNTNDTAHELGERDEGRSAGDHSLVVIILRLNRNELDIYNTIFPKIDDQKRYEHDTGIRKGEWGLTLFCRATPRPDPKII